MNDMAEVLAAEFGPKGHRIPRRPLPYWLMWLIARFDPSVRLALTLVGVPQLVSASKAGRELGWTARPARETVVETAESLISHGMVQPRAK
jgi:dihydroflavonol-4-reductase